MKTILVFGAGKSATVLIDYLKTTVAAKQWKLIVADANLPQVQEKLNNAAYTEAVEADVTNADERSMLIEGADLVISLLPPFLHRSVAKDCVAIGRHLLNASYVDEHIKQLEAEINSKELLFLCEMGLDPGIDHMSAMQLFDEIRNDGGTITSFKSHCGGLVAPESDNNPWHYKISWNPRNIVMAGHAGASYKENGELVKKTYNQVFENCKEIVVADLPALAWYPNRDSLSYLPLYKLEDASTLIRTTLRYADFCKGWDVIIDLGLTSETDTALIKHCTTYADWFAAKTKQVEGRELSLRMYLELYVKEADHDLILEQFAFLELDTNEPLPASVQCSADILQQKAEQKLALKPTDKDMIVMLHEIEYSKNNKTHTINSSLVVKGDNNRRTAMAKTVGLPLGIAAKLILEEKIKLKGLQIPTRKEIYEPVLLELQQHGVVFKEKRS
ncbi:MAG: saccharopine dehydrogenase C-terminal domain-containing protein [Lacibacter sp.]